jgi:hypothetical protein
MHRNENKYDQLFRDRLRDISHPVRNELWSRIYSRITGRKPSVPNPRTKLPLLSLNRLLLTTATAAAVLVITLGIIHFAHTHTAMPPSAQPVSSVTPRDSSRYRSNEPSIPANPRTTLPLHRSTVPSTGLSRVPDVPGTAFTKPNPTPENTATAHHHHKSAATETTTGTSGMEAAATTPGKQAPGIQTPGKFSVGRHNHNPVTLPALALTSNRVVISAGAPGSKSRHNGSNTPTKTHHFQRTGYVSLYFSPDFPNHNYTWSYTLGFRATLQFSPHWSFTSGFEYARVNVPTQVIPPVGYEDTLHSFYFSNYEVPVLFGYTRTFRHSTLTINGGAIINLYFHRSTGVWVFNLPDRDSYGAVLGVDYTRPLGRYLAIFAQPYARYSISDYRMFTQTQRWSFGTLLGIKYQL